MVGLASISPRNTCPGRTPTRPSSRHFARQVNIIDYLEKAPGKNIRGNPIISACFELPALGRYFCKGDVVSKDIQEYSGRVVSGALANITKRNSCRPVITELYLPTEVFGLDAIIMPHTRSEIIALNDSVVELVRHEDMRAVLSRHPELAMYLWRASLTAAVRQETWLAQVTARGASKRLAYLICDMFVRLGHSGNLHGNSISMPLLQRQVALMIGCSDIHANRLIGELRRKGYIEWRNGRANVHDWWRLARYAGFDHNQPEATVPPSRRSVFCQWQSRARDRKECVNPSISQKSG